MALQPTHRASPSGPQPARPVKSCPFPQELVPQPGLAQKPLQRAPVPPSPELPITTVTCGPGPQTSRPHGTRCRPQTGCKLQARAAGDRGQGAGSRPVGGPGPLPQSPLKYTVGCPPPPQRGPQTPPWGAPQRPGLGKDRAAIRKKTGRRLGKRPTLRHQSERDTEQPVRQSEERRTQQDRETRVKPDRAREPDRQQNKRGRHVEEKKQQSEITIGDKRCSTVLRVVSFLLLTQVPDRRSDCQAAFSKRHMCGQGRLPGMDTLQLQDRRTGKSRLHPPLGFLCFTELG